ncbi:hypothetical protein J4N02_00035 [Propioniciclava sp. MC1595]|uniref:Clp protease N-terminal domain-containing protein n=1 Tax=Propioniciclava sp. MC1595 TaxID=2760308 RepID=UPI0016624610|nr:Clp protease N-terminal domain-containing protein [Propioniciclava sp. MC1595]MBB1495657.1 hypothetical protein [Propioniciclava sp. MC1595]QTE26082.1 hypothetical protein J4N02_00035 [Propioniciclava sp. MC1595]
MTLNLANLWTTAAHREALRLRATRIDRAHLYLGLLQTGGDAARLLGTHGISLDSARTHVVALTGPATGPATHPKATLPLTPPAQALTEEALRTAPGTAALLMSLLEDPSGVVTRLVEAAGLRPAMLTAELDVTAVDPFVPTVIPGAPVELPAPARVQRLTWYVSVPGATVTDALIRPDSLDWWAYDPTRATRSGDGTTIHHHQRGGDTSVHMHPSSRQEDGASIVVWRAELVEGPRAGQLLTIDRFEIRRATGGCHITRVAARRSFGLIGRAIVPLTDRVYARTLMQAASSITYGVNERG